MIGAGLVDLEDALTMRVAATKSGRNKLGLIAQNGNTFSLRTISDSNVSAGRMVVVRTVTLLTLRSIRWRLICTG